jgi:phosphoserine phosphatase
MNYKLICFDVDGTLVDNLTFSWQLFHDYFQTDKHRREDAKNKFLDGTISYSQWANHDLEMWKSAGATKKELLDALGILIPMQGAIETLEELKKNGLKLAVISGSINIVLEKVFPDYQEIFDFVYLSSIKFDSGGNIMGMDVTKFDMDNKAVALKEIADKLSIPIEKCVFVGDYLNDLKAIELAGLGIAFNSSEERLKKAADIVIENKDLREILKYILN